MRKFLKIFLLLLSGIAALPAQAQTSAAFDTSRMERDLDIMNMVLDRLVFNPSGSFARLGGSTKGIYLPDYGVIFLMPNSSSAFTVYSLSGQVRRIEEATALQRRLKSAARTKSGEGSNAAYEYRTENAQDLKTPLVEFFSKYADAIGQLDDSERIAVYRAGSANMFYSFTVAGEGVARSGGVKDVEDVLAVARKADIVALRSGRLKADDFTSRVVFKNIEAETANSEIDIMARIIDTALRGRTPEQGFHTNTAHGIYLDDFGAIFFTNATFGHEAHVVNLWKAAEEQRALEEGLQKRVLDLQKASEQRRENWATQYRKFKQQLSEVIADYGHTLRQLEPQDNIVITAELDNAPEAGPNYLVCRVKKQQVEAFNARRISREQLLKMISYTEY